MSAKGSWQLEFYVMFKLLWQPQQGWFTTIRNLADFQQTKQALSGSLVGMYIIQLHDSIQ